MNKNFSTHRFYALFLRYWVEQKIVLLFLIALSVPVVYLYETGNGRIQVAGGFFTGALTLFLILFFIVAFRILDKKERLGYFLLLPASIFEKFLFLLLAGIIFPYLLVLTELYITKEILQIIYIEGLRRTEEVSGVAYFTSVNAFLGTSFVFFIIVTIRLLQKNGTIIKSFFVLVGAMLLLTIVNDLAVQNYIGDSIKANPFGEMIFTTSDKMQIDGGLYAYFLPYSAVLFGCFLIGLFYLTFLKFKELEKGL